MCNIKNTKKKSQAHCYSCLEEYSSCNVWICSLSVSSTIGGAYNAGIISLCHTPGIEHVVTPIQIVDLLNDKISTTIINIE